MQEEWKPNPGETATDYVERVGGWKHSNLEMMRVLEENFGLGHGEAETLSLKSRSFWESFFKKMGARDARPWGQSLRSRRFHQTQERSLGDR